MSELNDTLLALQAKVAEHLAADPYFAGIEILTEKKGDLRQLIKTALSSLGLSVAVITPGLNFKRRLGKRILFQVVIVVECSEIVLTNQSASGTKKPSSTAALTAISAVDTKPNGRSERILETDTGIFLVDEGSPFRLVPNKTALVYHAIFTTDILLTVQP